MALRNSTALRVSSSSFTGLMRGSRRSPCDAAGNCDVQYILINTLESPTFFAPYRGYTAINEAVAEANSNYNSLQVDFRHNVGHNLLLQIFYTWSHALDNVFGGGGSGTQSTGINDYDPRRWCRSTATRFRRRQRRCRVRA